MELFWTDGFWPFFFVVLIFGGGSAYLAGRAVAMGWQSYWLLAFYAFLLALAARFLLFGLFGRPFLFTHFLATTFLVLLAFGLFGHRLHRARQMVTQYSWLHRRNGPIGWRTK